METNKIIQEARQIFDLKTKPEWKVLKQTWEEMVKTIEDKILAGMTKEDYEAWVRALNIVRPFWAILEGKISEGKSIEDNLQKVKELNKNSIYKIKGRV